MRMRTVRAPVQCPLWACARARTRARVCVCVYLRAIILHSVRQDGKEVLLPSGVVIRGFAFRMPSPLSCLFLR